MKTNNVQLTSEHSLQAEELAKRKSNSCFVILLLSLFIMMTCHMLRLHTYGMDLPFSELKYIETTLWVTGIFSGFIGMFAVIPFVFPEQTKDYVMPMAVMLSTLTSLLVYCFVKIYVM